MKKDKQKSVTPKRRFPEFNDEGPWQMKSLGETCERIIEKVGDTKLTPVSITAGRGFVSQAEKFGRDISGAQYKNYIYLRQGDFAYNKGNSNLYPQGCVYRLKEFDEAAASNAFICFRVRPEHSPGFFGGLFEKNAHGMQLVLFLTSGARSDGLLNIKPEEFFCVGFPIPPRLAEQQKIADCLSSLDDLIVAQGKKVELLRAYKKGLMQQLFPREGETVPRLRFPEFRQAGEWEEKTIGDICKLKAGEFVPASAISDDFRQGLYPCYGGNGLRGYVESFTHEGTFVLIGRQGALCGNVNLFHDKFHATEHALVVTPQERVAADWLYYALGMLNLNRFSIGQAQPGLSVGVLTGVALSTPREEAEQRSIAECLSTLDSRMVAETNKLAALKSHKKGLMQQLFPMPEVEQ